eukprot:TRINITY_DN10492_c0_g1_i1.p1 TRINITY_DN10492_c0_g1~~TRINITY_DN10492_c0_g1_i1.p1  ORF type:complete len:495 (+),score=82.37 TRINITY_DN10492_c0_g1_i1:150-1487(+)
MTIVASTLISLTLAGNNTWWRNSGWFPSPIIVPIDANDLSDLFWPGQSSACVSRYGEFLVDYSGSYYAGCGYGDDVNKIPTTPTLDSIWNQSEPEPTFDGCVRACFSEASLPWGSKDPFQPLPRVDSFYANTFTPNMPFQSVNVIWSPSFNSCRCDSDFTLLNNTVRVDDTRDVGNCSHEVYELPLGCLFTAEQGCTDAPRDSCLWTSGNSPCCLDSKGFNWKQDPALAWRYAAGSFLLILAIFSWGIVLQCSSNRRAAQQPNDNSLEAELIESHKQRYETFLQKLIININPEDTISQCSICLSDLTEQQCGKFPCGHKLHFSCMTDYVMYQIGKARKKYPECPVCRQRVYDDDDVGDDDDDDRDSSPDRETGLDVVVPPPQDSNESDQPDAGIELVEIAASEQPEQLPLRTSASPPPSPSTSSSSSIPQDGKTDAELEVCRLAE